MKINNFANLECFTKFLCHENLELYGILKEIHLEFYARPPTTHILPASLYCCLPWSCECEPKQHKYNYPIHLLKKFTSCKTFGFRFCEVGNSLNILALVLSVCVQYNTRKWKSTEKRGRPGNTYHMNDVKWMVDATWMWRGVGWGWCPTTCPCTQQTSLLPANQEYLVSWECLGSCQVTKHMMM